MASKEKSIIIIGAGFAGLASGIFARMNGYDPQIFEMYDQPGGLCTSWSRRGYTFDGCIHWLVGSSPKSGLHDMWEKTGIAQGREFINMEEYMRMEDSTGRTLILYTDIERLKNHLLEFSPQDKIPIIDFIDGIKMCLLFDPPLRSDLLILRIAKKSRTILNYIRNGRTMQRWMNTSCQSFADRFQDPLLKEAFKEMWGPQFSMFFILFTFAYLHNKNAGYPIGGSLPMSEAIEERFKELGGKINYKCKVEKIITKEGKAVGIRLNNGSEHFAERVISAADGHATLFSMLEGKYGDDKTREPYEKWPLFPSLIFVSLGVKRTFEEIPKLVTGLTFKLKEPVQIGDAIHDKLSLHIFNHDPGMAPQGKTAITIMINSDYKYWKDLSNIRADYVKKKEEIGRIIADLLEQRFYGISEQIEITDVATPLTFERYTGNWKGAFEGWLLTPENSKVLMKPMSQTLPDLKNFYMCGQWVEPGGGLPTAIMSAQRVIKKICKEDNHKFKS
jgi:phytoene dehydrogenase-like protein